MALVNARSINEPHPVWSFCLLSVTLHVLMYTADTLGAGITDMLNKDQGTF
jgi:hypothetical protein